MFVKSMPRKSMSFGQLLAYINGPREKGGAILWNLRTTADAASHIEGEFLENARHLPHRKGGNLLYHEILSFSHLDRQRVTPAMIEDLTREYLARRAPTALAYAKAHLDTDCPHVHIVLSANELGSRKRLRLTRRRFDEIKRQVETYQQRRYPELLHSSIFSTAKSRKRVRQRQKEAEREHRLRCSPRPQPARKEELREIILREIATARSGPEYYLRLKAQGLVLYKRGQTVGVEDLQAGKRYRLKTLGLAETFAESFRRWLALPQRLDALSELELEQARRHWQELGFREELTTILTLDSATHPTTSTHERMHQLHRLSRAQARRQRDHLAERTPTL